MKKLLMILCIFGILFSYVPLCGDEPDMQTFLNHYYASSEKKAGYSKLLFALKNGYKSLALKFLSKGDDPNQYCNSDTPLMFAIFLNDPKLVQEIIKKGANVNYGSNKVVNLYYPHYCVTPLYLDAIINADNQITKILCASGAKIDRTSKDWMHYNPLTQTMIHVEYAKFKIIADTLRDEEINWVDYYGRNLFAIKMPWYSKQDGIENSLMLASYLLQRGVSIETPLGGSALANAANTGNIELMNLLISAGADINYELIVDGRNYNILSVPIIAAKLRPNNESINTVTTSRTTAMIFPTPAI